MKKIKLISSLLLLCVYAKAQDGALDMSFDAGEDGASVYAICLQTDNKILVGGEFTTFGGSTTKNIVRLNPGGGVDFQFDAGFGANDRILDIKYKNDEIFACGRFTNFNGTGRFRIVKLNYNGSTNSAFSSTNGSGPFFSCMDFGTGGKIMVAGNFYTLQQGSGSTGHLGRLNTNGTYDATFQQGTGFGTNSLQTVLKAGYQLTGKVLAYGTFTTYNGTAVPKIARFNIDGTLDTQFQPGTGPSSTVMGHAFQADDKAILIGAFTSFNGSNCKYITRLNVDGSVDGLFNVGEGPNGLLYAIAIQADGRILVGGSFSTWNGKPYNNLVRLFANGDLDESFNANQAGINTVNTIVVQPDQRILVGFNASFSSDRNGIVRLHNMGSNASVGENQNAQIVMYPNPANEQITLAGWNLGSISIRSIEGKVMFNGDVPVDHKIDISGWPEGMYLIEREGHVVGQFVKH